jgi:hypothetical protein
MHSSGRILKVNIVDKDGIPLASFDIPTPDTSLSVHPVNGWACISCTGAILCWIPESNILRMIYSSSARHIVDVYVRDW